MDAISTTALAAFLNLLLMEGGKTLAVESVKLALEKRRDIKEGFVNLFTPEEIIRLGLNEEKNLEEVTALAKANPEFVTDIVGRIKTNKELVKELEKFLTKQEGRTIRAKYYIENVETGHFS